MPRLVKQDDALWAKHLAEGGLSLDPGKSMTLRVNGSEVQFVPMEVGRDGRQTPGWKARGKNEALWRSIPKGTEVTIEQGGHAQPRIFWVNQGINYEQERKGGYVRAPKQNAQGTAFSHWKRVGELETGDLLVHYHDKALRALGRVTAPAISTEQGEWQARVEYFPLQQPISLEAIAEYLRSLQPPSGPFTEAGPVKQGYLWDFNVEGLAALRRHSQETWPEWATALTEGLSAQRMVKITLGQEARDWDACRSGGYICVSGDEVENLKQYASFDDFREAFAATSDMQGLPAPHISRQAKELWTLRMLMPGDRVLATRGTSEILAMGEVLAPGYEWRADRPGNKHTVRVKWDLTQARQIPPQSYWAVTTVAEVSPELRSLVLTTPPVPLEPQRAIEEHPAQPLVQQPPRARALDVAILTVIPTELFAVLDALGISNSGREKDALGTVYFRGSLRSQLTRRDYNLLVTCIGAAGNYDASAAVHDVIATHRPQVLLLMGIAAGIRGKVRIGEVVLSERIVTYESAAVVGSEDGRSSSTEHRPEIDRTPHLINQDVITYRPETSRLEARFRDIQGRFPTPPAGKEEEFRQHVVSTLTVRTTTIASGEKLIRDPARLLAVRQEQHGKVEVGEMEAAGLVAACRRANVPWLVIRGISDFGDQLKDDQFHELASRAAATVLADFLAHGLALTARAESVANEPVPVPHYPDEETRLLSTQVDDARARRKRLLAAGANTEQVDREILMLRRHLREGGRLRAGDSLGNGRFLLIESVGQGGFANIWKAHDRELRKTVAIKVLHTNLAGDVERRERFFRGARRMTELQHPGVVHVIEQHGEDGGYHYFVMEYVNGGNLRQAVLEKRVTSDQVIRIILRIGEALTFAHARGIIHRDIKPANILLEDPETPLLTDFDLVAAADTTGGTRTGAMGTFVYAAPECLERPQDADPRADVYSLGMTVIFGLHGADLPLHVVRRPEHFLEQLQCPPALKRVLSRSISLEPGDRYKDAGEFVTAVQRATQPSASSTNDAPSSRPLSGTRRRVRLTVHRAVFTSNGLECFFINATNLSENQELEVTHVWLDTHPQIPVLQRDRPLPRRLKPNESWETWIEVSQVPADLHESIYTLARARLSHGQILKSKKNADVPETGEVPGGPIRQEDQASRRMRS